MLVNSFLVSNGIEFCSCYIVSLRCMLVWKRCIVVRYFYLFIYFLISSVWNIARTYNFGYLKVQFAFASSCYMLFSFISYFPTLFSKRVFVQNFVLRMIKHAILWLFLATYTCFNALYLLLAIFILLSDVWKYSLKTYNFRYLEIQFAFVSFSHMVTSYFLCIASYEYLKTRLTLHALSTILNRLVSCIISITFYCTAAF